MSKTEGDGRLERELYPGHPEPPLQPQGPQATEYTIDVITSDISGAGTDANVKCIIFGDAGMMGSAGFGLGIQYPKAVTV